MGRHIDFIMVVWPSFGVGIHVGRTVVFQTPHGLMRIEPMAFFAFIVHGRIIYKDCPILLLPNRLKGCWGRACSE